MKRQRRSLSVEHFQVVLGGFGKMTAWRVDMLRTRLRLRHTDVNFSRTRDHVQSYLAKMANVAICYDNTVVSLTYPRVFPG
jgi:hypothetical protein